MSEERFERGNLLKSLPLTDESESFETLFATSEVKIERIVSRGHRSQDDFWYEQERNEWVLVLKGSAKLSFVDEPDVIMEEGDYVLIPALKHHRVAWTDPDLTTVWLAVHC